MAVGRLDVSRFIAKASTPDFYAVDVVIHPRRSSIACLYRHGIENAPTDGS
jgi:hypothetical protein